jgi:leucyl aminopeptidase
MEYFGAGKPTAKTPSDARRPLVLVGKGITYDSGGLNIKPSGYMHDMHLDMSGGAAVIASICAAAKLKLKRNIVALIPAAENSVSERAIRAGDIVTSHAGKTVEILHTDAEGRLVMADAFSYAQRYSPKAMLDVATLTSASIAALGQHASALMTRDDALRDELWQLGEATGDRVWPLPLYEDYEQYLKSDRADISNIATNFHRFGGASEAGTFLANFVPEDVRWAHLDMAPRMQSVNTDKLAKGATGEPVRLVVRWLETHE